MSKNYIYIYIYICIYSSSLVLRPLHHDAALITFVGSSDVVTVGISMVRSQIGHIVYRQTWTRVVNSIDDCSICNHANAVAVRRSVTMPLLHAFLSFLCSLPFQLRQQCSRWVLITTDDWNNWFTLRCSTFWHSDVVSGRRNNGRRIVYYYVVGCRLLP